MIFRFLMIFFLAHYSVLACDYPALLDFKITKEVSNLVPDDCTEDVLYFKKTETCACAKKNIEKFNFTVDPFDKKRKMVFVKKLIDKAKIGILSITNEISLISNNSSSVVGNIDLPETCDVQKRLELDSRKNRPVFLCEDSTNTLLSESDRKKISQKLANQIRGDIEQRLHPLSKKQTLINRKVNKCAHNDIPDRLISDINNSVLTPKLMYLTTILKLNPRLLIGAQNLKSSIDKLKIEDIIQSGKSREEAYEVITSLEMIATSLQSDPLFNNVLNSPSFFETVKKSELNPSSLKEEIKNIKQSSQIAKEIKENITKKCDDVFEALNKSLCLRDDDNILPKGNQLTKLILGEMQEEYTNEEFLISSAILNNQYCESNKLSKYDEVTALVNRSLTRDLAREDVFKIAAQDSYKNTIAKQKDLICNLLPPPIDKLDSKIRNECPSEEDSGILLSQKCLFLKATRATLEPQIQSHNNNIKKLAIKIAKKKGIDEQNQDVIDKIAADISKDASFLDIMNVYTENKAVDQSSSKNILEDFLGNSSNKDSNSAINEISSFVSATNQHNPGNIFQSHTKDNNSKNAKGSYTATSQSSRRTQQNLNEVYDEVTRRIANSNESRLSNITSRSPTQVLLPDNLVEAISSHGIRAPGSISNVIKSDSVSNNYNSNNKQRNTLSQGQKINYGTPQSEISTEQEKQISYNSALGGSQAAKKAFEKRAPKSNISKSPLANSFSAEETSQFYSQQQLTLNPKETKSTLNKLINGVIVEKEQGVEGENIEHAKKLIEYIKNKKVLDIISNDAKQHHIQLFKRKNGYRVSIPGNMHDKNYKLFLKEINRTIVDLKTGKLTQSFSDYLDQLQYAIDNGERMLIRRPGSSDYIDLRAFN